MKGTISSFLSILPKAMSINSTICRVSSVLSSRVPADSETISGCIKEIRLLDDDREFDIIKKLVVYPSIVCDALDSRNSGILFKFAIDLISSFNNYYNSVNILSGESKVIYARIAMLSAFKIVISRIFSLFTKSSNHKLQNPK